MSIYIVSEILLSQGDTILVGSLSYFSVNMIFLKAGVNVFTIPIDNRGIDVDEVEKNLSKTENQDALFNTTSSLPNYGYSK